MAMQYGVAQGLTIPTFSSEDSKTPTTPVNPVVQLTKDGVALVPVAGVVTVVADFGVHIAFTTADFTFAASGLKITSDNCDPVALSLVTEAGYTAARAAFLDASITSRSTYAGADTAGTTTLLSRVTATRAANLDNLDVAVSSVSGAGTGTETVTVTVVDDSGDVRTGEVVTVVNQNDSSAPLVRTTDEFGQAVFYINDTYQMTAKVPTRVCHTGGETDFTVSGDTAVTVTVTAIPVPAPAAAGYCMVSAYAITQSADVAAAGTFRLLRKVSPAAITAGGVTVGVYKGADSVAFANGVASLELLQGAVVELQVDLPGEQRRATVTIPAVASANFDTLAGTVVA